MKLSEEHVPCSLPRAVDLLFFFALFFSKIFIIYTHNNLIAPIKKWSRILTILSYVLISSSLHLIRYFSYMSKAADPYLFSEMFVRAAE